jgi:hypothetical protein
VGIVNQVISVVISPAISRGYGRQIDKEAGRNRLHVPHVREREIAATIKVLPMQRAYRRPVAKKVLIEEPTIATAPPINWMWVRGWSRR